MKPTRRQPTPGRPWASQYSIVDDLYEQIKDAFLEGITVANTVNIITHTMVTVEKIRGMSGSEKKETVIFIINQLVDEIPIEQENRKAIQGTISLFLPDLIDSIASVAKGQLDINRILVLAGNGYFPAVLVNLPGPSNQKRNAYCRPCEAAGWPTAGRGDKFTVLVIQAGQTIRPIVPPVLIYIHGRPSGPSTVFFLTKGRPVISHV